MCSTTYLPFGQRQQSTQVSLRGVRKIENDLYCIEALFSPMGSMPLIPLQVVRGNLYWGLQFFTLLTCPFQAWNIFQIRISVTLGIPGRQWNSQWQPWRCPGFIEILRYIGQKNQVYLEDIIFEYLFDDILVALEFDIGTLALSPSQRK